MTGDERERIAALLEVCERVLDRAQLPATPQARFDRLYAALYAVSANLQALIDELDPDPYISREPAP